MSKNQHDPEVEFEMLEQQITDLTEALQRERADAINVRRRAEEDKIKLADFYKGMVLRQFLPALDNLELALKHVPKELAGHDYVKGVQGIAKQFEKVLADLNVQSIGVVGEAFNPAMHEAISMEDGGGEEEVISEVLQTGYKIGDEIVRPAMVKVAR